MASEPPTQFQLKRCLWAQPCLTGPWRYGFRWNKTPLRKSRSRVYIHHMDNRVPSLTGDLSDWFKGGHDAYSGRWRRGKQTMRYSGDSNFPKSLSSQSNVGYDPPIRNVQRSFSPAGGREVCVFLSIVLSIWNPYFWIPSSTAGFGMKIRSFFENPSTVIRYPACTEFFSSNIIFREPVIDMSTVNPASIKASTPSYSDSTLDIHTWCPLFVQEVVQTTLGLGVLSQLAATSYADTIKRAIVYARGNMPDK